jgi:hypothetical protein
MNKYLLFTCFQFFIVSTIVSTCVQVYYIVYSKNARKIHVDVMIILIIIIMNAIRYMYTYVCIYKNIFISTVFLQKFSIKKKLADYRSSPITTI